MYICSLHEYSERTAACIFVVYMNTVSGQLHVYFTLTTLIFVKNLQVFHNLKSS